MNFSHTVENENRIEKNMICTCKFQAELNSRVFINSIVIAVTGIIGYTLAGTLITVIGKKKLMGKIDLVIWRRIKWRFYS